MRACVLLVVLFVALPATAGAEWQVKPFFGLTWGGATTFVDYEQAAGTRNRAIGATAGWLGEVIGIEGDMAWLTLEENLVDTGATGTVAATNVFARTAGEWRMILHHGSPIVSR